MRRATAIKPGKPLHAQPAPEDVMRFLSKVRREECNADGVDGPCWCWTGAQDCRGYGRFKFAGKAVWAHRFALEAFGDVELCDLEADHLCLNPNCVNPWHLSAKSRGENGAEANRRRAAVDDIPF